MCDDSRKLVAWIDGELSGEEMADMERHLGECSECRMRLGKYQQVSKAFDDYCDAVASVKASGRKPRMVAGLSLAAAALLAATVGWVLLRPHSERLRTPAPQAIAALPPVQLEAPAALNEAVHRGHTSPQEKEKAASLRRPRAPILAPEPAIQIAIPAESIFPPGAVPEGINFTADVSFGPDGTTRQIRLQPHLTGFERRTIQQ
jgi:anti-sigma factor RsiW